MEKLGRFVAGSLGLFAISVPLVLFRGWLITLGWRWFVVPVFPSLPVLGLGAAIGLAVFLGLLMFRHSAADHEVTKDRSYAEGLLTSLTVGVLSGSMWLLFAAIIHYGFGVGS